MALAYDTLFAHEYQLQLLKKSPLRRWIHKIRSFGVGIGALWLLLIVCGLRSSTRKAVHRALTYGSQFAREGSRNALQRMGKAVRTLVADKTTDDQVIQIHKRGAASANSIELNVDLPSDQSHCNDPVKVSGRERLLGFLVNHMDSILAGFLGYKLLLLVLYTMPITYGFGMKTAFLKWASKAHLFRVSFRAGPLLCLGMVGMATAAVHYSKATDTIGHATIRRRALGLLNGILTYCTARLFELIKGDYKPFIALEESAQERDLLAFEPPRKGTALLKMLQAAESFSTIQGLERYSWMFQRFFSMKCGAVGFMSFHVGHCICFLPVGGFQAFFWPQRAITPPQLLGAEELGSKKRRLLFVGNHAILGIDVTCRCQVCQAASESRLMALMVT